MHVIWNIISVQTDGLETKIMLGGYDLSCHDESRTYNNRSYNLFDICHQSRECISSYRIQDGYYNCADKSDEKQRELVSSTCEKVKRHRFRCSSSEPTCLHVRLLGDLISDCSNNFDESWMGKGTALSKINCHSQLKDECRLIREYVERSWTVDHDSIKIADSSNTIPFRAYCDTFWDLNSKQDEDVLLCKEWWSCLEDQWQCRSGQCIRSEWVLDGEWDCSDASDEQAIFFRGHDQLPRNRKLFNSSKIDSRYGEHYGDQPLSNLCDSKTEFSCFRLNASDPWSNIDQNRPCISFDKLGDLSIDCIGGLDEQNTLEYCYQPTMLGQTFKCQTSETCIAYTHICDVRCPHRSDDDVLCNAQQTHENCSEQGMDYSCFNTFSAIHFVQNTESVREPAYNKCTYWSFHYLIPMPLLPIITSWVILLWSERALVILLLFEIHR